MAFGYGTAEHDIDPDSCEVEIRFNRQTRWVARTVVDAGLARRCTIQLAYAIGVSEPVSVSVDTHGTGRVPDRRLAAAIPRVFDLSPGGIIRDLHLLRPIYTETSALGHFGRWRDPETYRWEGSARVDALLAEIGGAAHESAVSEDLAAEVL